MLAARFATTALVMSLTACGAQARPDQPHESKRSQASPKAPHAGVAGSQYRFVHPPLLLVARDGRAYDFDVYVHLSRALPRKSSGPEGNLLIGGSNPDFTPITLSTKPACYTTELYTGDSAPPTKLARPHDGQQVRISLRVRRRTVAVATARVKMVSRRLFGDKPKLASELRTIGCPRGRA
jgi:hypothetical protein